MKEKTILPVIVMAVLIGVGGLLVWNQDKKKEDIKTPTETQDQKQFASEYQNVTEDNVFVYRNVDEIIRIMEHGTGVVYLGYPECPWCQAYVEYLNEVAKEVGIEKIYYCNTKKVKEENMDKYKELISLLDGHLQYNDEGEQWIYVPNVSFHIEGEIIGNDYETSKDTHNLKDPKEYWTKEEVENLKETLTGYMKKVDTALSMCTDCNK